MTPIQSRTHSGFEQYLLARLRALPRDRGGGIALGFSGGADSLALAAGLGRVAPLIDVRVTLVHVDHRLRPESASEAEMAQELGKALGLPTIVRRAAAPPTELFPSVGVEEAARRVRYVALAGVAAEVRADAVATAHHADDQAETVLLHILRGSGLAGAAGMSELSTMTVPWWTDDGEHYDLCLWRPLLTQPRSSVRAYARATGLTPIEDPSNDSVDYTRNRLRHDVMPTLRSINPDFTAALVRYAELAGTDHQFLDVLAQRVYSDLIASDGSLPVSQLKEVDLAVQRRVLRHWIRRRGLRDELSLERVEAVVGLVRRGRGGAMIELSMGWFATVQHGMLRVTRDTDNHVVDLGLDPIEEDQ